MTTFNLYLSLEVRGYERADEPAVLAEVEAVLRKHRAWDHFLDDGMRLPLVSAQTELGGERFLKGGTERPVIVANPSGWALRSAFGEHLAERFGPALRAQFELLDSDALGPVERLSYFVEHCLCFNVEAARPDARPHVGALLAAYHRLPSWEARGEMHHLLLDQPPAVREAALRDVLSAPLGREDDLSYAQLEAALHLGALGADPALRHQLQESRELLEAALGYLRSGGAPPVPLADLAAALAQPAPGLGGR